MKRIALGFLVGVISGASLVYLLIGAPENGQSPSSAGSLNAALTRFDPDRRAPDPPGGAPADPNSEQSLTRLAATDPVGAFRRLAETDDAALRSNRMFSMAAVWADNDPAVVLDRIQSIADLRLRNELITTLLFQWSTRDTKAAMQYATGLDGRDLYPAGARLTTNIMKLFPLSPGSDPVELFEIAGQLPTVLAGSTRMSLLEHIADDDPGEAALLLDEFRFAERRHAALIVARYYAEADRGAALIWAEEARLPDLYEEVLTTIAKSDPFGALELAFDSGRTSNLTTLMSAAVNSSATTPADLAAAIIGWPESAQKQLALRSIAQSWLTQDLESAVEWMVNRADVLPPEIYRGAANRLSVDPDIAARYIDRLPPAIRSDWIRIVAGGLAASDPQAAIRWVDQYRGDPAFESSIASIANQLVRFDGAAAARLMDSIPLANRSNDVQRLAMSWAGSSPDEAAQWAGTLADRELRGTALRGVAIVWANAEPAGAAEWILGFPSGPARDDLLEATAAALFVADRSLASRLLTSIDSDPVRQRAVISAATRILPEDEAVARQLVAQHVTDPELLEFFERAVAPRGPVDPNCVQSFARIVC